MQAADINFEDFIGLSMERASRLFRQTEQYELLREDVERAEQDLKNNFGEDDYSYIESCFEILLKAESQETEFLYRQAYKDCVELLKKLVVLA